MRKPKIRQGGKSMKKLSVLMIFLLLFSLVGCHKTVDESELYVVESLAESKLPQEEQSESTKEEQEPKQEPEQKQEPGTETESEPKTEEPIEYPDGIQLQETEGESFFTFEHSAVLDLPKSNYPTIERMEPREIAYSSLMKVLGKDGLIVAGYASGLRESHQKGLIFPHTLTNFIVTDVYFGDSNVSSVKISEPYEVREVNGEFEVSYTSEHLIWLEDDKQVLLFLKKSDNEYYVPQYDLIPLTKDYRNYNEKNKKSILDFFRGVRSEYLSQAKNEPQQVPGRVNENGEIELYFDPSAYKPTFFWPRRDISDEELLAELSENVILRTVTDYEIVIWPYGHKNASSGYRTGDFAMSSKPPKTTK